MPSPPPPSAAEEREALAAGTRFGELEILRALGVGGFGIVYLARDHALEREVAIKEFMPAQLAQRGADDHVSIRSNSNVSTFEIGRRSFVNEARLLARFDHRSLLKVYRFWEANGTAYMAMPYLQGLTLGRYRKELGRAPDEAWLKQLLLPLLDALQLLHNEGVFHRDVAPDNIWINAGDGVPVLLDFGAARREISDRTQSFTAILKPSYAPIEQYAESTAVRQGPWTDLYALGAVLYDLLTGTAPPPATARTLADDCQPLAERNTPELAPFSKPFLRLIDWALAVRPADRPQSVAAFRAALLGEAPAPERHTPWVQPTQASSSPYLPTQVMERPGAQPVVMAMSVAPVIESPPAARVPHSPTPAGQGGGASGSVPTSAPARRAKVMWLLGALLLAVAMLIGVAQVLKQPAPAATEPPAALLGISDAASQPAAPASAASAALASTQSEQPAEALQPQKAPARVSGAPPAGAPVTRTAQPAPRPTPVARPVTDAQAAASAAPAASAASAPVPEDRFAVCARRSFLARDWCLARECRKPTNANHPECVRLRELRTERESQS